MAAIATPMPPSAITDVADEVETVEHVQPAAGRVGPFAPAFLTAGQRRSPPQRGGRGRSTRRTLHT